MLWDIGPTDIQIQRWEEKSRIRSLGIIKHIQLSSGQLTRASEFLSYGRMIKLIEVRRYVNMVKYIMKSLKLCF